MPESQRHEQKHEETRRPTKVADAQGTVHQIGQRRTNGRGRDDHPPEQERLKQLRRDLRTHRDDEQRRKNGGAHEVPEVHRHRYRVAPGFAEGGGGDLDDPEAEGDLGHLAQGMGNSLVQVGFGLLVLFKCSGQRNAAGTEISGSMPSR